MKAIFLVSESAVFPRLKNLHTEKTSNGSNFGWLIQQMSINQRSGRQTFRRRFVSGSLFVSQCPPECSLQSETKFEPDLRSLSPGAGCAKRGGPWTSQAPTSTKRYINPSYVFSVNKKDFIVDSTTFRKLYNLILTLQLYIKKSY